MTVNVAKRARAAISSLKSPSRGRRLVVPSEDQYPDSARARFAIRWLNGSGSWRNTIIGVVWLVVVAKLILTIGLSQQYQSLVVVGLIYAIVTTGIAYLYADGGMLSIAHGAVWGIGAYFGAVLATRAKWDMLEIVIVAAICCGLGSASLASISARVEGSYFMIILFAVLEVVQGIMQNWTSVTAGAAGISIQVDSSMFGLSLESNLNWIYLTLGTLIVMVLLIRLVRTSLLGKELRAIRDNRRLAMSLGMGVTRVHMVAFGFTGAMAGIGGVYWAYFERYVDPTQFSPTATTALLLIVLLGGAAYLFGPMIGALIVVFLPSLLHVTPLLGEAIIGVLFIIMILVSPQGIAGILDSIWRRLIMLAFGIRPSRVEAEPSNEDLAARGSALGLEEREPVG